MINDGNSIHKTRLVQCIVVSKVKDKYNDKTVVPLGEVPFPEELFAAANVQV